MSCLSSLFCNYRLWWWYWLHTTTSSKCQCAACLVGLIAFYYVYPPRLAEYCYPSALCPTVNRITHDRGNGRWPNMVGVRKGWPSIEKWLTFGGDPVPDTNSGYLLHFSCHSGTGLGNFKFISTSHRPTVIRRFLLRYLAKWLTPTREWIQYIFGKLHRPMGAIRHQG